jgi:hypothetical protein
MRSSTSGIEVVGIRRYNNQTWTHREFDKREQERKFANRFSMSVSIPSYVHLSYC